MARPKKSLSEISEMEKKLKELKRQNAEFLKELLYKNFARGLTPQQMDRVLEILDSKDSNVKVRLFEDGRPLGLDGFKSPEQPDPAGFDN